MKIYEVCKWNCPKWKSVWQMNDCRINLNWCDLGKGLKKSVFARLFLHEIARLLRHDVSAFTALMNWNHPIKIHRFTMKKERRFYDKQFKSSRVTFLYLYIRNQECTTTNTTKNFFLCACVFLVVVTLLYICLQRLLLLYSTIILLLCGLFCPFF